MDAAHRWETEAMRESRARRSPRPEVSQRSRVRDHRPGYVTLRGASEATGIPVNTLRKWARHDSIDSYLESDGERKLRMVLLSDVERRAAELGRTPHDDARTVETRAVPDGTTMIVPVDAWNKMLLQLGNLHEAGQQLAEARERAAKAETEAAFLRERLAELRAAEQTRTEQPGAEHPGAKRPGAEPRPPAAAEEPVTLPRWRALYRSLRRS